MSGTIRSVAALLAGLVALLSGPLAARADVFAVSDVAGLKAALTKVAGTLGPHTITLAAGTYTLTAVDNLGSFSMAFGLPGLMSEITVQGAGAATTIIERASAPGTPNFAIFDLRQNFGPFTLRGLTVRNSLYDRVGAVFHASAELLTVADVVFDNNGVTNSGGGAISTFNGTPLTITDSVFTNNRASHSGGAINGRPTVSNSAFENNTAASGGAIGCDFFGCQFTVTDSTFMNNSASQSDGGAISLRGPISITRSLFIGNRGGPFAGGGAVATIDATVVDSLFIGNVAARGRPGGAIDTCAAGCGALGVVGTTFQGNAAEYGGAVNGGAMTIRNSTFTGNTAASDGGGVRADQAVVLNNVTITGNTAGRGGGIIGFAPVTMGNTILAANTSVGGAGPDCWAALTSRGHNLIGQDAGCAITVGVGDLIGTGTKPINPLLDALADNPGKTAGASVDVYAPRIIPTHALTTGSPTIDAGDPAKPGSGGTACEATDQRGTARPAGAACDIGAFERAVAPPPAPAIISVAETIAVGDVVNVVPPAVITIAETITVTDTPTVVPPAVIAIAEPIVVSDTQAMVRSSMTTAVAAPNPSTIGQSVLFTATVTSAGSPVTQGTVAFKEGGRLLADGVLLDTTGKARFSASDLTIGSHVIVAAYAGSPAFLPSTATVTQTVTGNTPTGNNITVTPAAPGGGTGPATLTFAQIERAGQTSVVIGTTAPAPAPRGYRPGVPSTYYDLSTTATYTGTITVCVDYSGITFANESLIRLFHFENGTWVDGTTSLDTEKNVICGRYTSLSPFAIFELAATAAIAVTNENDDTVSLIDPEKNQVAGTVAVGHKPAAASFLDVFTDGFLPPARLYVGQRKTDDDRQGGDGSVQVLVGPAVPVPANALDFAAGVTIRVGNKPESVAVRPDGQQVWVANRNDDSISIVDAATGSVVATVPLGKHGRQPVAIAFSPDERYAYVAARNSNTLLVLDAVNAAVSPAAAIVARVGVGNKPVALAVNASAGLVYVVDRSGNDVAVVDVTVPTAPVMKTRFNVGEAPEGVALSPDDAKLYVTNSDSNTVSVFQVGSAPAYLAPVATITVGGKPSGIALTPRGIFPSRPFAYVANHDDDTVSVIDTTTDQVIATIPVGKAPRGVASGLLPTAP